MKKIITVILLLMMFITGYAQRIVVYKQLDESLIKVSASSELNKGTICSVVNGDGMQGCYHVANNLGHGMWLSEVSKSQFVTISLLMKELSGCCVILVKVENVLK